jgi:hypothetical protein
LIWIDLKSYSIKEAQGQYIITYTMDDSFLDKIIQFEKKVLERFNYTLQKKIQYPCYEHKNILYYKNKLSEFKLFFRVSGIWESETHIGLTTKIDIYPST